MSKGSLQLLLTRQFSDKPTRGQSSRGLVNSLTAIFFNHEKTIHYNALTRQFANYTLHESAQLSYLP